MKFSVIINNYNYGHYLRECVDSVLDQAYKAFEIIVVDDGSTDNSLAILKEHYGQNPLVKVICQKNGGQYAAIDTAIHATQGEVICFLDADDRYKPDYLAELEQLYKNHPKTDFVFCRVGTFGKEPTLKSVNWIWLSPEKDYDYGYSALLTYFAGDMWVWIGNVTSSISMKVQLARCLQLGELGRLWNCPTMADHSLVLGASLLNGRKYYLAKELVEYRVHDKNNWMLSGERKEEPGSFYKEHINHFVSLDYYKKRSHISDYLKGYLDVELSTIPDPLPEHINWYEMTKAKQAGSCADIADTSQKAERGPKKGFFRHLEKSLRARRKTLVALLFRK